MNKRKTLVSASALSVLALSNAHASGFLADVFIRPFSPAAADAADRWNAAAGNPVDHAVALGLDYVAPGAGEALEAYWQLQRSGILDGNTGNLLGAMCVTASGYAELPEWVPVGEACEVAFDNGEAIMGEVQP